ncbi:MAG TPA: DUF4062 domain-containing protein [Solirubrobacterales bacterium]|nr:DUF4062 domain-containing protein [Solirubrobacterales bacterium]
MKVFLSSTKEDLTDFREAVFEALSAKHEVTRMEDFPSSGLPPLDFCLTLVDEAELIVLLVGYRYGTRAREVGLSYTEAEYERAHEQQKPVLAYVRVNFEREIERQDQSSEDRGSLRAFREQVENEQTVRRPYFSSPDELARHVASDVASWESTGTVRPAFGSNSGLIRNQGRYRREATRRSALRVLPFPVALVNLATMELDQFPDERGGRLVRKVMEIDAGLAEKDIQASIFNNVTVLTSNDESILDQRLRLIKNLSAVIVCFAKTSHDLDRLQSFADVEEKVVAWHPVDTRIPGGIKPLYAQTYTPDDLRQCLLRAEAERHVFDLANQRLMQELSSD